MEERRNIIRSDDATKWGWLSPGLTIFMLVGLVGTAVTTAYIIAKQQVAAEEKQSALQASRVREERESIRKQFDTLRDERDALRSDVAELYAELEKLRRERSDGGTSRCIDGQRLTKRGAEWSNDGPC